MYTNGPIPKELREWFNLFTGDDQDYIVPEYTAVDDGRRYDFKCGDVEHTLRYFYSDYQIVFMQVNKLCNGEEHRLKGGINAAVAWVIDKAFEDSRFSQNNVVAHTITNSAIWVIRPKIYGYIEFFLLRFQDQIYGFIAYQVLKKPEGLCLQLMAVSFEVDCDPDIVTDFHDRFNNMRNSAILAIRGMYSYTQSLRHSYAIDSRRGDIANT